MTSEYMNTYDASLGKSIIVIQPIRMSEMIHFSYFFTIVPIEVYAQHLRKICSVRVCLILLLKKFAILFFSRETQRFFVKYKVESVLKLFNVKEKNFEMTIWQIFFD